MKIKKIENIKKIKKTQRFSNIFNIFKGFQIENIRKIKKSLGFSTLRLKRLKMLRKSYAFPDIWEEKLKNLSFFNFSNIFNLKTFENIRKIKKT